jgi:hypothetical protein
MYNQSKLEYMPYNRTGYIVEKYKLFENSPTVKEIKNNNLLINLTIKLCKGLPRSVCKSC